MRYQYEASRWRANEQPSRDANEARFQKLPVNARFHKKLCQCLDSDSELTA